MIRVLLADDHEMVRDGLRVLLETTADIHVIALASNGQEALDKAMRLRPNVAVIDVSMPPMNGIKAAREIRTHCPQTQVLMLSMMRDPEHIQGSIQAGALGYILKDEAGTELIAAIRAVSKGYRYFNQKITEIAARYI
jgi:DNA-binding NarL/FixJ family response regulator